MDQVWDFLVDPNSKKEWWFGNDELTFTVPEWKVGKGMQLKTADGEDAYRGETIERIENQSLTFNLHDAFEEDNFDSDFGADWNIEVYKISLQTVEKTKSRVTLEKSILEGRDNPADDPEFEPADVEGWAEKEIPETLQRLKTLLNG